MRVRDRRLASLLATLVLVAAGGYAISRLAQPIDQAPETALRTTGSPLPPGVPATVLDRHFREAVSRLQAGDYDHALVAVHRVLELAPRLPEAHVNAGFALLGLERYAAARDFFQSAIALRPAQVNAYWGLAVSLEALCDLAGATGAMRSYVHLSAADDPLLPKARAALWEWESQRNATGCTPGAA